MTNAVSRRTPGSMSTRSAISQLAKMAMSATPAGKYVNAAKLAWNATKVGKKLYNAATSKVKRKYKKTTTKSGTSKWKTTSTGVYAGKFKKPRKVKNSIFTKSLQYGYKYDAEEYGRVEDPDTVYFGHSTKHIRGMAQAIVGAMIRKLFSKAGYPIGDRFDELSLFTFNDSDGFRIEHIIKDSITHGETLQTSIDIVSDTSFQSLVGGLGGGAVGNIIDHFINYITRFTDLEPFKLILYAADRNGVSTNYRMASCLNLGYEKLHLQAKSTMTVQNRTAGANAAVGDKSSERVDNQPLEGYLYEFNQASPRLKFAANNAANNGPLTSVSNNGLRTIRAAVLDNAMQNGPDAKIWTNCGKKSKVILQPGEIKRSVLYYKSECTLYTFLNRIRNYDTNGPDFIGGAGKCQLLQLQETLRTVSANPVTAQYERHYEVGCFLKSTKTAPIKANLTVTEINDLP